MNLPARPQASDHPDIDGKVIALRRATSSTSTHPHIDQQTDERARALERICAGFRTTISPRSAARLADLMGTATARAVTLAA